MLLVKKIVCYRCCALLASPPPSSVFFPELPRERRKKSPNLNEKFIINERSNEWTRDERVSEWVNEWMCDDLLIQLVRDRQACALALCISFADIGEGALTTAMRRHLKFHKFINFLHGCRIIACYWKYFNEFRGFFCPSDIQKKLKYAIIRVYPLWVFFFENHFCYCGKLLIETSNKT